MGHLRHTRDHSQPFSRHLAAALHRSLCGRVLRAQTIARSKGSTSPGQESRGIHCELAAALPLVGGEPLIGTYRRKGRHQEPSVDKSARSMSLRMDDTSAQGQRRPDVVPWGAITPWGRVSLNAALPIRALGSSGRSVRAGHSLSHWSTPSCPECGARTGILGRCR
jgi:hypothetical protein